MSAPAPLYFRWDGESMTPLHPRAADRQYVVGEVYRLGLQEGRSDATHRHEFAWLREAWQQLPETLAELYPTPSHLRKRALIEAGYYDEEIIDVGTNAGALRVAASLRKIDDFAVAIVRGGVVIRRTAKSQSRRSMDRATFQASKTALMEVVAGLIGVTTETLRENAA